MEVSGLAAMQERYNNIEPVKQSQVRAEIEEDLEKLPQYSERINSLNLKQLK